ncbi:MAG TPA: hypothetical protein PLG47_05520 [Candidatus Dojkabacteria bacterium]|nr:hypothetical protein [Candidatus Dojkabacteria bacterium]
MSDIIKVNHLEASSEIAIELMKEKYRENGWEEDTIDKILYDETDGILTLKETYQDQFNDLYDFIWNILDNIKEKDG